jgi:hypothetical protein
MQRLMFSCLLITVGFSVDAMKGAECGARHSGTVVVRSVTDGVLHRRWTVVEDCTHPERPWVFVPDGSQESGHRVVVQAATTPPPENTLAVRAGAKVLLTKISGDARIVLTATALRQGRVGDRIQVRAESGALLEGKVVGLDEVELVSTPGWKAQ